MRTTWIGYVPDERTIEVPAGGLEVTITLVRVPFRLDTLTIVARRTGIFGTTVQRSDLRTLGGVDVAVLGTHHRTRTTADGTFLFGDVREGGWVVLGKRDGFVTRMITVVVPDSAAVELALALDTVRTIAQHRANNDVLDLQSRVTRRQVNSSALVPGQEFALHRGTMLDVALRFAPSFLIKGLTIDGSECVHMNGAYTPALAREISAEGVILVEAYNYRVATGSQRFVSPACGGGPIRRSFGESGRELLSYRPPREGVVAYLFVWTR